MSYLLECRLPAWRLLKELPSIKVRAVPSRLPSRCRGPEPLLFLGLSPIHVLVESAFRQIHFLSDCKPICTCVRGSNMHSGQKSISERAESQGCVIPGISRTSDVMLPTIEDLVSIQGLGPRLRVCLVS